MLYSSIRLLISAISFSESIYFTFIVTILIATKAKGFLKIIPFLVGIIAGYIVSLFLGMIDVTPIKQASILSIPYFYIPLINYQLVFLVMMKP